MGGVDWEYLTRGFERGFGMGLEVADRKRRAARDAEEQRRYQEHQDRLTVMDQRSAEQFEWQRAEQDRTQRIRQGAVDIEDRRAAGAYNTPESAINTQVPVKSTETFRPADMGGAAAMASPGEQLPNVSPQAGTQPARKTVSAKKGGEFDGAKYYGDLAAFYRRYGDAKTGMEYDNLSKQEPHRVFTEQVRKFDQAVKLGDAAGAAKALEDTFNKGFPDGRIATVDFEDGVFRARFFNSVDGGPMGEQVLSVAQAKELAMSVMDPKSYNDALLDAVKRKHDFDLKAFELYADIVKKDPDWHPVEIRTGEHTTAVLEYINRKTGEVRRNPGMSGGGVGAGSYKDHTKDINAHLEKSGDEGFADRVTEGVSLTNQVMNFNKNVDAATGVTVAKAAMQAGDKGVHIVTGKRYVPFNGRLYALDPSSPQEIKAAEQAINAALEKQKVKPAPAGDGYKKGEPKKSEAKPAPYAKPTATRGRGAPAPAPAPNRARPSGVRLEEPEVRNARKKLEENDAVVGVPIGPGGDQRRSYADGGQVGEGDWNRIYYYAGTGKANDAAVYVDTGSERKKKLSRDMPLQYAVPIAVGLNQQKGKKMADGGQVNSVRAMAHRDVEMLMGTGGVQI